MSEESPAVGNASTGLERQLGLLECVLLSVGGMVGSAIFVFPGTTGRLTGPSAIVAWMGAGVLMTTIALCYTELSLAFPQAGGPAVFPYETLGPSRVVRAFASYLEGVSYSVGWAFGITVSALAIADYVGMIVPAASGHAVPIALTGIALSFLVNALGVSVTSRVNLVFAALLLAILVVFAALGLARADPANYRPFVLDGPVQFLAAVQVAITAYGAWTVIPASAEEIREPTRTIPRAIVASLAVSTVLYGLVLVALHGQVAPSAFVEGNSAVTAPLGVAATALGVPLLRDVLLPFAALVAIFTTMLVGTMSAGRVLFALGRNGTLPGPFGAVSDRFQVPWVGLAAVSLLASALATVPQYFFQLLVVSAIVGTGLPYAINLLSFVGLRYYRTDVDPGFRAPGGYALAGVAFVTLGVAMIGLGLTNVLWSLGTVALLTGVFVVRYLRSPELIVAPTE
ncbi:amino acid/polyamine/organocation transporter, APC superfamily [Halomicrobium zhouii]|uniref:Amino acid/polyamine/organocation transporter, APC superfamily n=1 Tax=Halomicrobium zhouii TaxID=767519 RepID=A0A1I6L3X7_9EURY|nr:APC family permease [Halomicrobium zhouii]SFR97988.1 amino acid/polyamine/organocation transporter, APC superfamily [Halomicrobium zhouii]